MSDTELLAYIQSFDSRLSRVETTVASIADTLAERRGGKRVATWLVATLTGLIGAFSSQIVQVFQVKR